MLEFAICLERMPGCASAMILLGASIFKITILCITQRPKRECRIWASFSRAVSAKVNLWAKHAYQKMSDAELNQALGLIGQEARALNEKNLKLDIWLASQSCSNCALKTYAWAELNSTSDLTDYGCFADNYGDLGVFFYYKPSLQSSQVYLLIRSS